MPSSVVVATRKAVVAGLVAVTGTGQALENVLVTYGWKPDGTERECIFTMRARGTHTPASLRAGRTIRNEEGTFQVVVHVEDTGGNADSADTRALALGLVVEEWIADNTDSTGVTGLNWLQVESWELSGGPADRSYISQLFYTVRFNARLT